MKLRKFLAFTLMATTALNFIACDDDDDDDNSETEQINTFLQSKTKVQELSFKTDDEQYEISAYANNDFHVGYNEIFFVAQNTNGEYIKDFSISNIAPLMHMVKMDMYHSTPTSGTAENFDNQPEALKRAWVSFIMASSKEVGSWYISYDATVLGKTSKLEKAEFETISAIDGQRWVQSFKVDNKTYFASLVNPSAWEEGINTINAYVSVQSDPRTNPYLLASEKFTIEIDPRMPDMGNHTSPDNKELTPNDNGLYSGTINLTMTGLWRIHFTVKNAEGKIVAGGDDQNDGLSSLYWDVTL